MQFELHGFKSFDELLAFHCAPALTGIKPANLVSCPTASMPVVAPLLADYTEQFADKGIAFEVLCHCAARTLVLVYQPQQLEDLLQKQALADIQGFIKNKGKNCKCSGYWKVYDDVEHAKRLFDAYNKCRDRLLKAVAEGVPLHLAAASF